MKIHSPSRSGALVDILKSMQEHRNRMRLSNKFAKKLILELQIRQGLGLSVFLNTPSAINNYEAVLVWVKRELACLQDDLFEEDGLYLALKLHLLAQLPSHEFEPRQ